MGLREKKKQEEIYLYFHYSYFIILLFFWPHDHLIKKDCCFKTIYEVLYKCDHVFSNSLHFHRIPNSSVLRSFI